RNTPTMPQSGHFRAPGGGGRSGTRSGSTRSPRRPRPAPGSAPSSRSPPRSRPGPVGVPGLVGRGGGVPSRLVGLAQEGPTVLFILRHLGLSTAPAEDLAEETMVVSERAPAYTPGSTRPIAQEGERRQKAPSRSWGRCRRGGGHERESCRGAQP